MKLRYSDLSLPASKIIRIYDDENNQIIIPQIEKGKHYTINQTPKTKQFVEEIIRRVNGYDKLKDKISSKDHAINRLIVTINKLKDRLLKYENIMRENGKAIVSYQNKLHRRNMQIEDLKKKVAYAIQELKEFGSIEAVKELNA